MKYYICDACKFQFVRRNEVTNCPDCGKELHVFGESRAEEVCAEYGIPLLGRVPLDPKLSSLCDKGIIELNENTQVKSIADAIEKAFE